MFFSFQKLNKEMAKQRADMLQKLEARRKRQSTEEFEQETAVLMLKHAESQHQQALDRQASELGAQRSLVGDHQLGVIVCAKRIISFFLKCYENGFFAPLESKWLQLLSLFNFLAPF